MNVLLQPIFAKKSFFELSREVDNLTITKAILFILRKISGKQYLQIALSTKSQSYLQDVDLEINDHQKEQKMDRIQFPSPASLPQFQVLVNSAISMLIITCEEIVPDV